MGYQGSYIAFNVGDEEVDISPTGSGGGRSDLVVLRVEDPNIDGTPWGHDVTSDPVYYFRVIEGVSSSATEPPSGMTAIALARIDIPSSTGTITSGMITDVRASANPKSQREVRVQHGAPLDNGLWDKAGDIQEPNWERWPQHEWAVNIPWWATQVQVLAHWDGVYLEPNGATTGPNDARGQLRVRIYVGSDMIETSPSRYNVNQTSPTNGLRCSFSHYDQVAVPPELRGQSALIRMAVSGGPGMRGRLVADNWAVFATDLEFLERPAPAAEL